MTFVNAQTCADRPPADDDVIVDDPDLTILSDVARPPITVPDM